MKKYINLLLLFVATANAMQKPAMVEPSPSGRMISYGDLLNHNSSLWRVAHTQPYSQKMAEFLCDEVICIDQVPSLEADGCTAVSMHIMKQPEIVDGYHSWSYRPWDYMLSMCDAHKNECIEGFMCEDEALLYELKINPQPGSGVLKEGQRRLITGTTALALWDNFWMLCGVKKGTLEDAATFGNYKLRELLPYVCGCSWYMKQGYSMAEHTQDSYRAAVTFLASRSCRELLRDYEKMPVVTQTIHRALSYIGGSEDTSMGELVSTLYNGWRKGELSGRVLSHAESAECEELLFVIYKQCIAMYSRLAGEIKKIREQQEIVRSQKLEKQAKVNTVSHLR